MFFVVAYCGHVSVVDLLLQSGADVSLQDDDGIILQIRIRLMMIAIFLLLGYIATV